MAAFYKVHVNLKLSCYSTGQYFWRRSVFSKERNMYCMHDQVYIAKKSILISHVQFSPENREAFALEMESIPPEINRIKLRRK